MKFMGANGNTMTPIVPNGADARSRLNVEKRWLCGVGTVVTAVTFMALTAALTVPRPALAQSADQAAPKRGQGIEERQQARQKGDEFVPIGARVGSFQLFPAVDVDVEYGDNIFAVTTGAQSDTLTRVKPELSLNSDWNQHALNLKGAGEVVRYKNFTDDNVENYNIAADGRVDVLRILQLTMGAGYTLGHEDRGDPNAVAAAKAPSETAAIDANLGVKYKPNRLSSQLDATYNDQDFDDATNRDESITNNDPRDRKKYELVGRLGYEYLPETEAFFKVAVNQIDYNNPTQDGGPNRDSDGYSVVVGTDLAFTGLVTGDVFAGYLRQTYDDASLKTRSGPTAGTSVQWDATPLITVNGSLSRSIQETTIAGSSGFLSTLAPVSADYEILRQLTADASFDYTDDTYSAISRDDQTYKVGLGAKYLFNRNFIASLGYTYNVKESSNAGNDYKQHTALLTLRGQF